MSRKTRHNRDTGPVDEQLERAAMNLPAHVAVSVARFTAPNAGPMTLHGTNTYVVGQHEVYVVDPGPFDARHLATIEQWIRATNRTVLGVLLTHGHPDHAEGAAELAGDFHVPVWAAQTEQHALYALTGHAALQPGACFQIDSDTLRVIPTPGHTPDSVTYVLERESIVFTGDTVLGQGTSLVAPPEGNMSSYISSLQLLQQLHARLLAPGHGPVVKDPTSRVEEYLAHRRQREDQLVQALAEGPITVESMVERYYGDTPPPLRTMAAGSVLAGLIKLEEDGSAFRAGEVWNRTEPRQ